MRPITQCFDVLELVAIVIFVSRITDSGSIWWTVIVTNSGNYS